MIHLYPNEAPTWVTLSSILIQMKERKLYAKEAANLTQIALNFGQTNMDVTKVCSNQTISIFFNYYIVGFVLSLAVSFYYG